MLGHLERSVHCCTDPTLRNYNRQFQIRACNGKFNINRCTYPSLRSRVTDHIGIISAGNTRTLKENWLFEQRRNKGIFPLEIIRSNVAKLLENRKFNITWTHRLRSLPDFYLFLINDIEGTSGALRAVENGCSHISNAVV